MNTVYFRTSKWRDACLYPAVKSKLEIIVLPLNRANNSFRGEDVSFFFLSAIHLPPGTTARYYFRWREDVFCMNVIMRLALRASRHNRTVSSDFPTQLIRWLNCCRVKYTSRRPPARKQALYFVFYRRSLKKWYWIWFHL